MTMLFGLLRRGYVRLAATLLICSGLLAIITASIMSGGIRNPGLIITPLILTVSTVLLGSRATTILGTLMAIVCHPPFCACTHGWELSAGERRGA